MVRYFYGFTPLAILFGTAAILSNFFFAMLALVVVLPVALAALLVLAGAIVASPYLIGRSIVHRWHETHGAPERSAAALIPAKRHHA